jgi:hypothetical protein
MSYGWLTESSLIPKPAKKINVENSSVRLFYQIDSDHRFKSYALNGENQREK